MAGKRLTTNQKAYISEMNRIENEIRNLEQQGYSFDDSIYSEIFGVFGNIPRKIYKKDISRLQEFTTPKIAEKGTYDSYPHQGEIVINRVQQYIDNLSNLSSMKARHNVRNFIKPFMDEQIEKYGNFEFARRVNENAKEFLDAVNTVIFYSDQIKSGLSEMVRIVQGSPLSLQQAMEIDQLNDEWEVIS